MSLLSILIFAKFTSYFIEIIIVELLEVNDDTKNIPDHQKSHLLICHKVNRSPCLYMVAKYSYIPMTENKLKTKNTLITYHSFSHCITTCILTANILSFIIIHTFCCSCQSVYIIYIHICGITF